MKVVEVVPIARGIKKDTLHYFSADDVSSGDFLEAPLRNKTIIVQVVEVFDPKDLKTQLRSASFSLKKAKKIKDSVGLNPAYIKAVTETAEYFLGSLGSVLQNLLPPKTIFNQLISIKNHPKQAKNLILKSETMVYQAPENDRLSSYKSILREQFARHKSVFFVLPTNQSAEIFFQKIKIGLEAYTFLFHSDCKKNDLIKDWRKAINENHPVVIVATPAFVFLPRLDFGTFILENEASRFYKKDTRPFVDTRFFIEKYTSVIGANLVLADSMIRSESVERLRSGKIVEFTKPLFRLIFDNEALVVNFPNKDNKVDSAISSSLEKLITFNHEEGENLFIFVPRLGLSPVTFCRDCFSALRCPKCNSYLTLEEQNFKVKNERIFSCYKCGYERNAKSRCDNCNSWNLKPLFFGIDAVFSELEKKFPDFPIFKTEPSSNKKNQKIIEEFFKTKGAILVGTETTVNSLPNSVKNIAVLSSEALFTLPEYSAFETAIRLLLRLRLLATNRFLIQNPEEKNNFLLAVLSGNLLDFYDKELLNRQTLKYPPFSAMLVFSGADNKTNTKHFLMIEKDLKNYHPVIYEKLVGRKKMKNIMIKVPITEYPNQNLTDLAFGLPPDFEIKVNPYTLF